ncbi:nucleotidyltransferase-like protein [Salimicrobium halophilum]|uniref:Nucleotidyltransferase-like n=1 Tax=Salimicrobium halophilum TaxID=86666 RepID=A0A1G8WVA8_9BACI|nr:nucleotidyltransferase-like protein [Salimicrobium halophilum]SDJ81996.1 Nucleotidyltransferase-like [Salimicrobium halophilum]
MEDVLRPIYQERASYEETLGILYLEKKKPVSPVTDNFDVILLVVVKEAKDPWYVKHYEFEGRSAALHVVEETLLHHWIRTSTFRRAVEWVTDGTIVFERNDYITLLKKELQGFPERQRGKKKVIEFAKLIRSYSESTDLCNSNHYLDAFSRMVRCLHYLARLSIIEKGFHPEVTVWNQVKRIDPEIYKLYEELIESEESINKRVELMVLALDHSISRRAENSMKHFFSVMKEKDESWTFGELKIHPEVKDYALDLSAMMEYAVKKGYVKVELHTTKGKHIHHRKYRLSPDL